MNTIIIANKINLAGQWDKFFGSMTSGWGGLLAFLGYLGVALLVITLVKWAWDRRRTNGLQNSGPMMWTLIPGAILVAPQLIKVILQVFDFVANMVVNMFKAATGAS